MKATINLNDHVWVRLTQAGQERYVEFYSNINHDTERSQSLLRNHYDDISGYYRFSLYELIAVFGGDVMPSYPTMSFTQMLENNSIILTNPNS